MLQRITKQILKYNKVLLFVSLSLFSFCGKHNSYSSSYGQETPELEEQQIADSIFNEIKKLYTPTVEKHFKEFLDGDNPLSFASHNSKIYFIVSNVVNDKDFTFLKLYIVNNSSSKYSMDDVILMQVEDPLGRKKSSFMLKSDFITPIEKRLPMDKSVNAGGKELVGFVIPLYSGIDNGKLIIQIFEKNGSRNGKIEISAKDITRAKIYDQ